MFIICYATEQKIIVFEPYFSDSTSGSTVCTILESTFRKEFLVTNWGWVLDSGKSYTIRPLFQPFICEEKP